jgi:hypothetical protein
VIELFEVMELCAQTQGASGAWKKVRTTVRDGSHRDITLF